ncbi:hypothetical protein E4U47_004561 [Claviceps purpurea]|nr:hypothetical protein E4U47_004561 [Claviceps purpurea]
MQEHVDSREHLTGHVYVDSLGQFKNASFIEKKPKPDNTIKSNNQRLFWPAKADLFEVPTKLVAEFDRWIWDKELFQGIIMAC